MLFADSQVLGQGLAKLFQEVLPIWGPIVAKLVRRLASGDGLRGPGTAAAVAARSAQSPAWIHQLPGCLPLLQHHSGVWGPGAARCPARNPAWNTGGNCVGLRVRREGCVSIPVGRWEP